MKTDPEELLTALRGDGETCFCGRPLLPQFDKSGKRIGVTHSEEDEDYHLGVLAGAEIKTE